MTISRAKVNQEFPEIICTEYYMDDGTFDPVSNIRKHMDVDYDNIFDPRAARYNTYLDDDDCVTRISNNNRLHRSK